MIPAKPRRVRGQPIIPASVMLLCVSIDAMPGPGWRSVQRVMSVETGCASVVPGTRVMEVGEKVQVVALGRPEQEKVSVPLIVLDGVMKMVASVVEPWATATRGLPLEKSSGPGVHETP